MLIFPEHKRHGKIFSFDCKKRNINVQGIHSRNQTKTQKMTFFSDRLQSSGVGAILHSLVQTLLRLRLRPANPVQWMLTELKAGRYYLEEQSFLLLLQQYVAHAAVAAESNDVDHPTMLAQLVVLCLSNFSAMFVRMHDRRLLDEQSRLTFAVLFADGFMWEQLPTERRLSSSGRDSLRLSEYLQTAGRALKYLACLRQTIVPDEKAEKAIFYSVLDLAEVVLKLRCFAAQGEIDSFGDSVICFDVLEETNETAKQKDVEGETGAALNYSLSMRSRRRLSVQYVIPMAPCTDGMGPTKRQTPLEVLDEMQRLSKSLLSACGFAEASVRFLVCDLPTPPRLQQDTMAALRIRWGPISEPSTLQAALRTTDHLEQQLQNGEHPSLRLHPHSVQRGRYRAPAADDSVCCQNGWCTALQRSLGSSAATTSSAAGDAEMPIADLAPPCVIFLPLPVASLVNAAPLLLVLGSCLCRTLSAALLTAVPTFRAPPVGGDTPSNPAPSVAGKSKKAGKDGGATAAAAPAASAAPSAPTPAAGATVTTPEGTAAARREAFGDAYEVLFGGLSEAEPHTTTQQPSLFGILLDTSNIVPTISQRAAGVLLTAVLQDVLPLLTSGEKSTTSSGRSPYLSPMLAVEKVRPTSDANCCRSCKKRAMCGRST